MRAIRSHLQMNIQALRYYIVNRFGIDYVI